MRCCLSQVDTVDETPSRLLLLFSWDSLPGCPELTVGGTTKGPRRNAVGAARQPTWRAAWSTLLVFARLAGVTIIVRAAVALDALPAAQLATCTRTAQDGACGGAPLMDGGRECGEQCAVHGCLHAARGGAWSVMPRSVLLTNRGAGITSAEGQASRAALGGCASARVAPASPLLGERGWHVDWRGGYAFACMLRMNHRTFGNVHYIPPPQAGCVAFHSSCTSVQPPPMRTPALQYALSRPAVCCESAAVMRRVCRSPWGQRHSSVLGLQFWHP